MNVLFDDARTAYVADTSDLRILCRYQAHDEGIRAIVFSKCDKITTRLSKSNQGIGRERKLSDLEKIYAHANRLGSNRAIQLRWEGAGDCAHPTALLSQLKMRIYENTHIRIKFHAVLNLYEAQTSDIAVKARNSIEWAIKGWVKDPDQTYEFAYNVDVTRDSKFIHQNPADIMFVRNIMPTNDQSESLTDQQGKLEAIHVAALRHRSNSLDASSGALHLGMSGAPGLAKASQDDRKKMELENLFVGAKKLVESAQGAGLNPTVRLSQLGGEVFADGQVMKNNGKSLEIKPTYYLTFVK